MVKTTREREKPSLRPAVLSLRMRMRLRLRLRLLHLRGQLDWCS
jgi:hypothetical protein